MKKEKLSFDNRLKILTEVSQAVNSSLNVEEVLKLIVESGLKIIPAERGLIILREGSELIPKGVKTHQGEPMVKFSRTVVWKVLKENQPLLTNDAQEEPALRDKPSIFTQKIRSVLCVPLRKKNGEAQGVLYLDSRMTRGAFTSSDLTILTSFANQASLALENAQLYTELEKERQVLKNENVYLKKPLVELPQIIGQSKALKNVLELVSKIASSSAPVLICGETGTGKELIARAIHAQSKQREHLLVPINCGAIPEQILEAELFGYEKGAFTGAAQAKEGLLELAHQGTVILDEISEMPVSCQVKLLRFLQEGELRRVGGVKTKQVSVRVIASTNQNLPELVKEGKFRADLYWRLAAITIYLPPLRERLEDIPLLAEYFLKRASQRLERPLKKLSSPALKLLTQYSWPGNIRELENVLTRALLIEEGAEITPKSLSLTGPKEEAAGVSSKLPTTLPFRTAKSLMEKEYLRESLKAHNWNISETARMLQISRVTLHELIRKHQLIKPR